ncbi:BLUF domain-containing protein [uncultured Brevundimonas sp.]|uniref:BLUF domain-containing protein n=1 Tax=uncultured Brevundimonas sp. TaxID=213418 RepID=UPI000FA31578|nr:BLUF domain-containing protein [uncultured Brevundimonas sp.]
MNTLDQLVYCSRARLPHEQAAEQIADIVHVSAFRNAQVGVTGALALSGDVFVQILEGSPTALDILMLHLHFDARHDDIVVLARERITRRAFPIWGMIAPQRGPALSSTLDRLIVERSSRLDLWRQALQTEELGDGGVISRFSTCSRQAV